jgi:hypothetical protein
MSDWKYIPESSIFMVNRRKNGKTSPSMQARRQFKQFCKEKISPGAAAYKD